MANVNHSSLTDPYLHEPKGIASANANEVYTSNGSGSGVWKPHHHYVGAYVAFDSATPAYTKATTTSYSVLNPTLVTSVSEGFTVTNSPNARLVYSNTIDISAHITLSTSTQLASGSSTPTNWAIYKNGSILAGSETIRAIASSSWGSVSVIGYTPLTPNDYIEVYSKATGSVNVQYASFFISIMGVPT